MDIKKAAFINAAGKYSKILLNLVVSAILSRILSAQDYGIVAVITVFSTFFTTFADMGFGTAIIQNKTLSKEDIDNIFSFTVYISFALMVLFMLCSFPISWFYSDGVYIPLGMLLSISLLFNAMNMVPNGILNREKKFVAIAWRTVVVYTASSVIAILLAFMGARYYALVWQSILSAFFTFLWNWLTTKPKFSFHFAFASVKKVMNYSGFQFAFNIVNYFSRNLDNLLTGKFMGAAKLGYYNKAYNLMLYPVNNLTGVISPVLHPILSDYQNQKKIIYQKYMQVVKLLMLLGIFIAPLCFLAGGEMITILYGSSWTSSIVCFQILSIAIIPQMINASAGAIFQAIGNTRLLFYNGLLNSCITLGAICIGVFFGRSIEMLSVCVAIAYCLHFLSAFTMLICVGFHYSLLRFFSQLFKEWIMLVVMVAACILYPFHISGVLLSACAKGFYLLAVFCILLAATREYKIFASLLNFKTKKL